VEWVMPTARADPTARRPETARDLLLPVEMPRKQILGSSRFSQALAARLGDKSGHK